MTTSSQSLAPTIRYATRWIIGLTDSNTLANASTSPWRAASRSFLLFSGASTIPCPLLRRWRAMFSVAVSDSLTCWAVTTSVRIPLLASCRLPGRLAWFCPFDVAPGGPIHSASTFHRPCRSRRFVVFAGEGAISPRSNHTCGWTRAHLSRAGHEGRSFVGACSADGARVSHPQRRSRWRTHRNQCLAG